MYKWTGQYQKTSEASLKIGSLCSALIIHHQPTDSDLYRLGEYLGRSPIELVDILGRLEHPSEAPKYDGEHHDAIYYDNNVQFRLLLSALSEVYGFAVMDSRVIEIANVDSVVAQYLLNGAKDFSERTAA